MNLYAMYNSLEWLCCQDNQACQQITVAVRSHDSETARIGIAPMVRRIVPLRFQFFPGVEFSLNIRSLELLGSEIVGEQSYECLAEIVEGVWKKFPDVNSIYFKSVSSESELWDTLSAKDWKINKAFVYKPDGNRPFHYVALPSSYEEFMDRFPSKQRFTLRKKLKKMTEAFPGTLEVRRIIEPSDLDFLTSSVRQVIGKSWKAQKLSQPVPDCIANQAVLRSLAEKDLLRSYVLLANGMACAFIVGYAYKGIYHYADLAYDTDYAQYSPGTVLLLMMIKNLIEQDKAKCINFGITDAQYKRVFGNRHVEDASLLVLRPSLFTTILIGAHRTFRAARTFAKLLYKKAS